MKISYIYRAPSKERSIERVFASIVTYVKKEGHDVRESYVRAFRFWPFGLIYNIIRYAILSMRGGVFHITGDVQYIACLMNSKRTFLTVHDCVPLHNTNVPKYSKWLCYWLWYYLPLKHLKYITCISEATRKDLISFFPWVEHKLSVIPNPVGDEFRYVPKEINVTNPRILHVGTRSNKNLERVIESLDGVQCQLVIIGELTDKQRFLLQRYNINYINRVHISDEDIVEEYRQADIISFPSLFEGFGMPIIEGQATGRPVITSNIEPMCSVAGNAAILVDPYNIKAIKKGLIGNTKKDLIAIVEKGLENAKRFHSQAIAQQYISLYKQSL